MLNWARRAPGPADDRRQVLAIAHQRRQADLQLRAGDGDEHLHEGQNGGPNKQREFRCHGAPSLWRRPADEAVRRYQTSGAVNPGTPQHFIFSGAMHLMSQRAPARRR